MRYSITVLLILLLANCSIYTQPQPAHYNNWIFGENAGITFSTNDGNPKLFSINDKYTFIEGTSSISNDKGDLLYFIYFAHQNSFLMSSDLSEVKNSSGIETSDDVSNTSLFIQDFSKDHIYYILTTGEITNNISKGINYSILDRNLNSGKGEVILKNKLLFTNATEKMTAVMNQVDNICWVITHERKSNSFKIIRVDENGLDENIITQEIGLEHKSESQTVATGRISMSPNGTTLAVTIPFYDPTLTGNYKGEVELFDFDPKTGLLSNARQLDLRENTYALSFSPNGKILYVKTNNKIYQYDLTICDIKEMIEKRYTIKTKPSAFYNAIERGPNGIIYCGRGSNTFLDAILNPDIFGEGCNYTEDVIEIGGTFKWGLPTVINSYFTGEYDKRCELTEDTRKYEIYAPTHACFGDEIEITIKSNYDEEYEVNIINNQDNITNNGPFFSYDSLATCTFGLNYLWNYKIQLQVKMIPDILDTLSVQIQSQNCCSSYLKNRTFNTWNKTNECWPVDYQTDMFFSSDSNVSCELRFQNYGELKSTSNTAYNSDNFVKTPTVGRLLVGDPQPNIEQRAWYQNNATRIGTKYKFSASVCNVEKIPRFCEDPIECKRSLNMWLGVKNRNQELILQRVYDIEYDDDWIQLSGEFVALDNYTELSIWVLGTSEYHNPSWGFAIDFVDLEILDNYNLKMFPDTTLCLGEEILVENQFDGEIVDIEWSPITGLNDPYILNPIASPSESTNYTLKITDKYDCEFIDNVTIGIDSCLDKCLPCVSFSFDDLEVNLGDTYCINGSFVPYCSDSTSLWELTLYFEYDPYLMNFVSSSGNSKVIKNGDKNILKLEFDKDSLNLNASNQLNICFTALLGIKDLVKFSVYEDPSTKLEVCVLKPDSAQIKYLACNFPLRRVNFITATQFEARIIDNRIGMILSTEEQGIFKFELTDINGSVLKQESFSATNNKYNSEEVTYFNLNDISSGVYIVKMQTPSGKIISQNIIITK